MIRRLMELLIPDDPNHNPEDINYMIITYDCSTGSGTNIKILGDKFNISLLKYMYIDGKKNHIPVTVNHDFKTAKQHTVKFVFKNTNVLSISHMFDRCEQLVDFDFSYFIMNDIVEMKYVFFKTGITDVYFNGYSWPKLTTMEGMFDNCVNSNTIKFINCETPKLNNLYRFCSYSNFKSADFSGLDTTNVTTMLNLFSDNWYLKSFKLMYPVDKLTNTQSMFRGVILLKFYYNKKYNYDVIPNTFLGKRIPV